MSKVPLLEIEPKELKFIFELKKQSSCSVQLTNNTHHYVAFKVKTTSPKKYSVRPNVGVLLPNSTCEFIVTMQAQRVAPADMDCKDKFLIQSTVVSAETTSEDVTSSLFVKEGSRYIEENKLKVALISSPDSPEFSPVNSSEFSPNSGDFKSGLDHEKVQIYSKNEIQSPEPMVHKKQEHMVNEVLKLEANQELKPEHDIGVNTMNDVEMPKEAVLKFSKAEELNNVKDVEELKLNKEEDLKVSKALELNSVKNVEELNLEKEVWLLSNDLDLNKVKNVDELKAKKEAELPVSEYQEFKAVKDVEELKPEHVELKMSKDLELETVKNVAELKLEKEAESKVLKGVEELNLMKAIEEMKSKLDVLESKLNESAVTISRLTEERMLSNQETKILQEKLANLIKKNPRTIQVGFPLLYVCTVALICVFLGYHLHC